MLTYCGLYGIEFKGKSIYVIFDFQRHYILINYQVNWRKYSGIITN